MLAFALPLINLEFRHYRKIINSYWFISKFVNMNLDIRVTAAALGIALLCLLRFRVFVPMLVAGPAGRFHVFNFLSFSGFLPPH